MRILFLTDNFPPEVNAPATRSFEHCREWVRQGEDVTVITCAPNFPQGRVYPGYRNKLYKRENMDGIEVIRVWTYITANEGVLKRTLDYMSFALSAFLCGLFRKADVTIATSPQFFTTWAAYGLSLLKGQPWVFELRDLWPESIKTVGAMDQGIILDFLERVELFLYHRANRVVALTPAFKDNLISRGVPESKVAVVPNGTNLKKFRVMDKDPDLLKELGFEGKFVIGYIGTHGLAHSLEFIVSCLNKIGNKSIHFLFIGDGARKKQIVRLALEKKLNNATFLNPISNDEVPRYMSIIDAALVPLKKADTFRTVLPSKIFEAAGMQKPILLGVDGQAREIVEFYEAGLFFEPENESSFLQALDKLVSDGKLYHRLQQGCAALAQAYDRERLAKEMLSNIYELM
ncbi:MAG: glycosyltransferase WbuB [Methanosarcinales archaeon]|nr:MAG: glycosyltransferase WbuB [Methanosarcinales archaeon]